MTAAVIQDLVLNSLRKNNTFITIFLINGYQVKGVIKAFDSFTVLLEMDHRQTMVYKHAISSVNPSVPVDLSQLNKTD